MNHEERWNLIFGQWSELRDQMRTFMNTVEQELHLIESQMDLDFNADKEEEK